MPETKPSGNQIRQEFIDFFVARDHTFVPSSPLVPGGDQTLLFANSGMVQFKDVFLGTDNRPYTRAANSQKCMRVAGKHNDLDDVGRDNTHHTFFEMLGNWSFGDYYKAEAIQWAWELLTEVWSLPRDRMWASCFEDELGEIPRDDEAAEIWRAQPGFDPDHVVFFGRDENFWEMAETGPCGPNSEIHLDRGIAYCDRQDDPDHVCRVNGDCTRFLELWNLVFMQYNRLDATTLQPLPKKHVDTGMGFERLVSVLQDVDSNYKTDLLAPLMDRVQELTGDRDAARRAHLTPYRVIADHARASTFLIADGVVPGNTGRNYVCRMIIRRAARFGREIGLVEPFLAEVARVVIDRYGDAYPEIVRSGSVILETITREESRFQRTLEAGLTRLESLLIDLDAEKRERLPGDQVFDLYATYGLPLEITRDIARDRGLDVDQAGFEEAMEAHRVASGAGAAFGELGGEQVEIYQNVLEGLQHRFESGLDRVSYDPYHTLEVEEPILAMIASGEEITRAEPGDRVEVVLPSTCFYLEAGGQVADTGWIVAARVQNGDSGSDESTPAWSIEVQTVRQPAAGVIVHEGVVEYGHPHVGELAIARVDARRRQDIRRNHTATHLLHHQLRTVLGEHAWQAGSLVAPDRLRFDFTHPEALSREELERIERGVNRAILEDYPVQVAYHPRQVAIDRGAIALFGEKYGDTVRTIAIGEPEPFSYELCGGTHLDRTGEIGVLLITSESSIAAGVRRIEAVTGRGAYELIRKRFETLDHLVDELNATPDSVVEKMEGVQEDLETARRKIEDLRQEIAASTFERKLDDVVRIQQVPVLAVDLPGADSDTLRRMADRFRQRHATGVAVLAGATDDRPILVATVTQDLVERGLDAVDLVRDLAEVVGGGGGGRASLAQAGGKNLDRLDEALARVIPWVERKLQPQKT